MRELCLWAGNAYLSQHLVDDTRVLKVIIGCRKEVKLVDQISYVDTTQWIHLRKGQYAWISMNKLDAELVEEPIKKDNVLEFLWALLLNDPANAENLFVILGGVDRHRHIVVRRYYLHGSSAEAMGAQSRVVTSWKSSLKRRFNNSAYLWNNVSCRLFIMDME